jgi:hypothetical protein
MSNPTYAAVLLDTGDATKSLIAAPSSGNGAIFITAIHWSIKVAAAQVVKVGVSAGTEAQQCLELAASASGNGTRIFAGRGFKLPKETALTAVPASAGPAIHFIVEYSILPANS